MAKADNVGLRFRFLFDGADISPDIFLNWFSKDNDSTVEVRQTIHAIAGSASDEVISIDDDPNVAVTLFWDTVGVDGTSLTIKKNGSSDAILVQPIHLDGKAITSLSVSNSDASTKYLSIVRIYTSGNAALIEGE